MKKTIEERFEEKVDRSGDCHLWTAGTNVAGYGRIHFAGAAVLAHRVAVELDGREIPEGMGVMHTCDNPPCVNPAHLVVCTHAENMADMKAKGRGNAGKTFPNATGNRGEKNGSAKLTEADVKRIRYEIRNSTKSHSQIAEMFGVCQQTVSNIHTGRNWK
ncbi:MAG TPA: HNH endonuclease [Planctomycetes bacterium]|jgi:hypothetical protein|nr:HNH endonuclease [Planctomycetota bacterium]